MTLQKRLQRNPQPHMGPPMPALDQSAQSHILQIAERKVVGGVYIQEDIAHTMRIPFGGTDDMGLRLGTLAVSLASSAPRDYSDKYPLDASRNEAALWAAKNRMETLAEAVIALRNLVLVRRWDRSRTLARVVLGLRDLVSMESDQAGRRGRRTLQKGNVQGTFR